MMQPTLGILSLILLCCTLLTTLTMVIFCYRKIDLLEGYLEDCKCISDTRSSWGGGIIGRQMRMNMVSIVMTFPKIMHAKGYISADANLRIPRELRTQVFWHYLTLHLVFGCMIAFYAFIKIQTSWKSDY
jgi:hypothetical protein